ncbi:beta strand repeat-containing protein [Trinickia symbiotica]|uniref:beta strand repeat-containing protein n=1 Tax=Trinickia symbiotica TaxID=863227 RepID=UPI000379DC05|nr:filamentous hemagglutinin N-terminal domain-containing protein [Trinickia symbiotica]
MKEKTGNRHEYPRKTGRGKHHAHAHEHVQADAHGEGPFPLRPIVAAAFAAASALGCLHAAAAPAGGQITAGAGTINAAPNAAGGATTIIQQGSNRLAINWTSFDIGSQDSVTFAQPGSSAIALNRVTGQSPTQILGTLNANGQVFILNPNGVLFGKSAQVNVGGLLASTLNLSDSDFLAGKFRFTDSGGTGRIVNEGQITANGGYIAFIAPRVSNQGSLIADKGTVELAAGSAATVTLAGNQLVSLTIDQGTLDALAENGDLIRADGGVVILTSKGKDAVLSGVVNNTGEIVARTAVNTGGTIKLIANGGTALVGGTLDASAPNGGNGGTIETSGEAFQLQPGATITTHATNGQSGTWLIDPSDIVVAASGGDMTGAQLSTQLGNTNIQLQTSSGSGGVGDITINDGVVWNSGNMLTLTADHDIKINASLDGGATGSIVASATHDIALMAPLVARSLTADAGGTLATNEPISLTGTGSLTASGAITLGASVTALQSLNVTSGSSIAIDGPIILDAGSGTLTLSATGTISPSSMASIATGTFDLQNGAWVQVGGRFLPGFSASNFVVGNGASFLRALSGSGTTADPYLIGDVYGLQGIGTSVQMLADSYKLANSIDASGTSNWNGGLGFAPIGNGVENAFLGTFDGNGKTISGLTINNPNNENIGLFGFVRDGAISNVSLTHFNVTGSRFVGALVGINQGGTISNVSVDNGTVTATSNTLLNDTSGNTNVGGLIGDNLSDGSSFPAAITNATVGSGVTITASGLGSTIEGQVGGLVGWNRGGVISHSGSAASVTGDNLIGGLVGLNDGSITMSSASGPVTATQNAAGGLVGQNTGTIAGSSATGTVNSSQYAGGLVGLNGTGGQIVSSWATGAVSDFQTAGGLAAQNDGSIVQSFSSSAVTAFAGDVGGLVGLNSGTIADSYALGLSAASSGVAGGLVGDNEASIATSYATGFVSGRDASGGLVAVAGSGSSVTRSYWNIDTTGLSTSAGGTGLTNAHMLSSQTSSFSGFDFSNVWRFIPGTSYPYLVSIFSSTPTVFSGTYTNTSGAVQTAKTLDFAAHDQLIASLTTGANGFYYLMLPSTAFNGATAIVAFSPTNVPGPGTALGAAETSGASVSMNLQDNFVALAGSSVTLGDIASALGNPFSGGAVSSVASLVPAVLTNLQSNALATANGVSLASAPGTELDLTGDTSISAAAITLGSVSGSGAALTLQTSGGDITQGGAFTLGVLGIPSAGNVTLDGANQIGTVAAMVSGSFSLNNASQLTVGQAGSTRGITAGGTVTLTNPGYTTTLAQSIDSSASGDAVILVSAGFANLFGPSVVTTNGRWLIYTTSPDADSFGGLQSGNSALWAQGYSPGSNVSASGNRYLFSTDQVIFVNANPNQKMAGQTAQESATLSLKYAGSSYGDAFTDATVPSGVTVSVYSNGDAASATRAGGDDGVGLYRIRYTASNVPAGYAVADGTVADLTVVDPQASAPPSSTAPSSAPAVINQVQAVMNNDADSGSDGDGNGRRKEIGAVLAAFDAAHATPVSGNGRSSILPAWPVANACVP